MTKQTCSVAVQCSSCLPEWQQNEPPRCHPQNVVEGRSRVCPVYETLLATVNRAMLEVNPCIQTGDQSTNTSQTGHDDTTGVIRRGSNGASVKTDLFNPCQECFLRKSTYKYDHDLQEKEAEIARLKMHLRDAQVSLQEQEMRLTDHQRYEMQLQEMANQIAMYQTQVRVYAEDFRQERSDREHAQTRISDLEAELSVMSELLSQGSQDFVTSSRRRREDAMAQIRRDYYRGPEQQQPTNYQFPMCDTPLRGRVECDGDVTTEHVEDDDIIDLLQSPDARVADVEDSELMSSLWQLDPAAYPDCSPSPPAGLNVISHTPNARPSGNDDDLQCPRCGGQFPLESHGEFLEHIDICCQ